MALLTQQTLIDQEDLVLCTYFVVLAVINQRIMTKTIIQEALAELPDEFSLDDLMERLILLQSFEQGRNQYEQGKVFTQEEVGRKLEKWLR